MIMSSSSKECEADRGSRVLVVALGDRREEGLH